MLECDTVQKTEVIFFDSIKSHQKLNWISFYPVVLFYHMVRDLLFAPNLCYSMRTIKLLRVRKNMNFDFVLSDSNTTGMNQGWESSSFWWKSTFLVVLGVILEIHLNLGRYFVCVYIPYDQELQTLCTL